MAFELNKEKALDVLIWWMQSTDGSIDYSEEQAVQDVLKEMNYSLETYYKETVLKIGAMGTEEIKELVSRAIEYGANNYDENEKRRSVALLRVIADYDGDGEMSDEQRDKLSQLRQSFGLKG